MTETESGNGKWKRKTEAEQGRHCESYCTCSQVPSRTQLPQLITDLGHSFSLLIHGLTGTMSCNQDPIDISSQSIQDKNYFHGSRGVQLTRLCI